MFDVFQLLSVLAFESQSFTEAGACHLGGLVGSV